MSVVSNVIITAMCLEDDAIQTLGERIMAELRGREWVDLSDKGGGTKAMECSVLMGAFNYLDVDKLAAIVASVDWDYPDDVQLLVKGQHDNAFSLVALPSSECPNCANRPHKGSCKRTE